MSVSVWVGVCVPQELQLPMLKVSAPELVSGVSGESEQKLRELFDQSVVSFTSAPSYHQRRFHMYLLASCWVNNVDHLLLLVLILWFCSAPAEFCSVYPIHR